MKRSRKKPPSQREPIWIDKLGEVLSHMHDRLMAVSKGGMSVPLMKQALLNSARLALGDADDLTLIRAEREQVAVGTVRVRGDRPLAGMMRQALKDEVPDWRRTVRPEEVLRFVERSFDLMFGDDEQARWFAKIKMRYAASRLTLDVYDGAVGPAKDDVPLLLYRVMHRAEKGLGDEPNWAFFAIKDLPNEQGVIEPIECIEDSYRIRCACGQTNYREPSYRQELLDLIAADADALLVKVHNDRGDVRSGAMPKARLGNLPAAMRIGEDYLAKIAAIQAGAMASVTKVKTKARKKIRSCLVESLATRDRITGYIDKVNSDRKALLEAASGATTDEEMDRKIIHALDTSTSKLMEAYSLMAKVGRDIADAVLFLCDVADMPTPKQWTANSHTIASYAVGSTRIELSPDWSKSLTPPGDVEALAGCVHVEITAA